MKELISKPELCSECMKCERNCPNNAIHVLNGIPVFCMHCNPIKAPCLNICPEDAIFSLDGAIIVNQELCIGCGQCRDACPIGAIVVNESGYASKCDLCYNRDERICVSECPSGALLSDSSELASEKQGKVANDLAKLKDILK